MSDVIVVMRDGLHPAAWAARPSCTSGRSTASSPTSSATSNFPGTRRCSRPTAAAAGDGPDRPRPRPARARDGSGRATLAAGDAGDRRHPAGAAARSIAADGADGGRPGWTPDRGTDRPGHVPRRPDGVPGASPNGGRVDRPPPERNGRGGAPGARPGRSRRRPMARGGEPGPRWLGSDSTSAQKRTGGGHTWLNGISTRCCDGWRRPRSIDAASSAAAGLTGAAAALAACSGGGTTSAAPSAAAPLCRCVGGERPPRPSRPPARPLPGRVEKELFMYNWADYIDPDNIEPSRPSSASRSSSTTSTPTTRSCSRSSRAARPATTSPRRPPSTCPAMVEEGFIQKLDVSRIPNLKYINPTFKGLWWDPTNEYQRPEGLRHDRHPVPRQDSSRTRRSRGRSSTTSSRARHRARRSSSTRWATSWSSRSR